MTGEEFSFPSVFVGLAVRMSTARLHQLPAVHSGIRLSGLTRRINHSKKGL